MCDQLTVVQAALLIIGSDATAFERDICRELDANPPEGYQAVLTLLTRAINTNKLKANNNGRRTEYSYWEEETEKVVWCVPTSSIACESLYVEVDDLKVWLQGQKLFPKFFFPESSKPANEPNQSHDPDYLDPFHPNYSAKLAAAVCAWEYLTAHPEAIGKRSVKKAIEKWLREHAIPYGLTDRAGRINETAIEEVSKVANWNTVGGAPKTSG
jgi:hypothetical protein